MGNDILEQVIGFVSLNISDQDWKKRYSALIALGAITEGPDRIKFMNIITPGLNNLFNMFTDGHGKVREAIAWVIQKICENHCEILMNESIMQQLMGILLNSLQDKPRISN